MTKGNRLYRKLQYLRQILNVPFRVDDDILYIELYKKFWNKNFKIYKQLTASEIALERFENELIKKACVNKFFINCKIDGFDKK